MLLGGELQVDAKNSNFEIFESALCTKSGSMPLMLASTVYASLIMNYLF